MEQHTTFPNKVEAFFIIVGLIVVELLVAAALRDTSLIDAMDWNGAAGLITVVGNGVLFVALLTYKRLSYRSLFHPSANSVAGTLGAVSIPILLIVPGVGAFTGALNLIVQWLVPMSSDDAAMFDEMMELGFTAVLFSCVGAPVLEEMLFRGVILRSFMQQYSRTEAILWSSLLFGLAHLNPYQFVTAFFLGVLLGWLYHRTHSLWPSILLHAVYNTFVTFGYGWYAPESHSAAAWSMGASFVLAIVGGFWLLRILEPSAAAHSISDRDRER